MNREEMNANGNLIVRFEEPYKKNKRQIVNMLKREKKKEKTNMAKVYRSRAAQGRSFSDEEDDDDDDEDTITDSDDDEQDIERDESFYRSVPANVCNVCGQIFNSVQGRKNHMTTRSRKHQGKRYAFDCKHTQCGCYYAREADLSIHRALERH